MSPVIADSITGKIIRVVDGDTVHLLLDHHNIEKIRLAGIDAPERRQAHGSKARKYLSSLLGNKFVNVEYDKRDRYGRIVGKIFLNNEDINLKMIQVGYAWHYKKYQREQSSDDRLSYAVAENNARRFNLGLFQNEAIPPWEWRKNKKNKRSLKPHKKVQMQTLLTNAEKKVNVWVNLKSGKYHCSGTRYYENTKRGELLEQSIALSQGYHPSHGSECQ